MKAKQFISFLMASAMVVSFAACSDDDENTDPVPPQQSEQPGGNEGEPGNTPGAPEGPAPIHSLSKTDTLVGAEGCTFDVIINCNVECVETSENPEMLTVVSCTKGEGDICTMTVTVAPNNSYDQVEGKIKVEFLDAEGAIIEDATAYFTVTQDGAEAPTFTVKGEAAQTFEYAEALVTFEWETNCTVGEPVIEAEWITLDRQNATGARFVVAAFNLPCDSTRTATIVIPYTSATGEEFTQELTINQTGKTTFTPEDLIGTKWIIKVSQNPAVAMAMEAEFKADGIASVISWTENGTTGEIIEPAGEPTEGTYTTPEKAADSIEGTVFCMTLPNGMPFLFDVIYDFKTTNMSFENGRLAGMTLPMAISGTGIRVTE